MNKAQAKARVAGVVLVAGGLPWLVSLAAGYHFGTGRHLQEPVHECLELVGTCLAFAVAMLLLLRAGHEKNPPHLLWVIVALVAMGLVDGVHAVMPLGIAWSWLRHGATFIGGLLFGLVWLRLPEPVNRRKQLFAAAVAGLTIVGVLDIAWRPDSLPTPWDASGYTLSVKVANMLGGLGFVAGALFFLRRYLHDPQAEDLVFASQAVLFGTASLLFGYSHLWAADWWAWHCFRLAAYAIVLVAAYQFMIDDIAERKRAEETARLQAEQYTALVGTTSDGYWLFDLQGKLLDVNEAYCRMSGYTRAELLKLRIPDIEALEKPEDVARHIDNVVKIGFDRFESQHRKKDGGILDVEIAVSYWQAQRLMLLFARDITERKRAIQEARKASLYARSLIEASLDPLVTIRRDGKIMDVNQATELATGVSRERLIGSDFCDYFTDPDQARHGYRQVFAQGRVRDYALALRHVSGSVIDVLYNAALFKNEAGEVEGIFAAARDISERKLAEKKLQEQAALLDLAHDAILLRSLDGTILFWNRGAKDLYGWTAEEARGRISQELLQTEFPDSLNALQATIQETREWDGELQHSCRDGRRIVVASRWSLLRNEQEKPTAIMEINRDITDRKQAEERLRKASLYTRSLIEASLDPLVTINPQGKITDVNQATEKATGVPRGRLIGSDFSDYFTNPEEARRGYQEVFTRGSVHDYPLAIRHRSGEVIDVLYNATIFKNETGQIEGVFAAARDITQRKKAEQEIRKLNDELEQRVKQRTAQLEASNRELEAFTYSVSHDLRAPLRHIGGFSKILLEEFGSRVPAEAQRHLQRISEGTRRMGLLVDDLLNLTRLGRQEVRLQVTGLNSVVDEALAELKPECEGRQVEWKIGSLPFVECDPSLIKQVFQNLLSNALKFSRPRTEAVIEVGQKEVEGKPVIFVRDNGVGFSLKYADKLFGVFQRLHRAEDFEGTGVGLATVQRIIHKHGGRVWAEAELDKGATFYFTLGRAELTEAKARAVAVGDEL